MNWYVQKPHRVRIRTIQFVYKMYELVCMNSYKNHTVRIPLIRIRKKALDGTAKKNKSEKMEVPPLAVGVALIKSSKIFYWIF